MGIRGLMTYIRRHRDLLKPHDLHGGYLVIDGNNFASQFYTAPDNTAFGGDWRSYTSEIETFFDELDKCKVIPLVVLKGGRNAYDLKKLRIKKESMIEDIINYTPPESKKYKITTPLSIMVVFKSILKKRGIRVVRPLYAENESMAGVAKALDCPVLTFNSAFLICGVKFIPIDTLESGIVENSWRSGYNVKRCKIFQPENLLKSFRGLSSSMFPLLLVLLDGKCIQSKILDTFFNGVQWPDYGPKQRLYSEELAKIEATLLWLKDHDLNNAISSIIKNVSKRHQQKVLKIIENAIDKYANLSYDMLKPLGLIEQFEIATRANRQQKKFESPGKINDTENEETWRENETPASDDPSSEEEPEDESKVEVYNHLGELTREIIDSLPQWFLRYYTMGGPSTYFANLILHRIYIVSLRAEVWKYPSAMTMSLKIVRVIDGLLSAGRKESSVALLLFIRDGMEMVTRSVDTLRRSESTEFPPLRELRDTPMEIRKRILDDTIEISREESSFEDIPDEWRLYAAVIVYWMRQKDEPLRDSCHMRAVVLTMFLGIVDEKAGSQRSQKRLRERNGKAAEEIESKRLTEDSKMSGKTNDSIEDALKCITNEDCRAVTAFFNTSCEFDFKAAHFNVKIAHVFTQFVSSLHHAIDLNDLLKCPYEQPTIQKLYNGTMLYNVYEKLAKEPNADDYIAVTLKDAPSILRVFNLLTNRIETILDQKNDA